MSVYGTVAGGLLAIVGAVLPWLTLNAGLQRYSGTIGPYGWLIVAAGATAIGIGVLNVLRRPLWLSLANVLLGVALLCFTAWLMLGLQQLLHRPDMVMSVPRAGPGLYVVLAGAIAIALSSAVQYRLDLRTRTAMH